MIVVELSPEWEAKARAVGVAIQAYAERAGYMQYGGRVYDRVFAQENHIIGCRGECAVAKILRMPWRPRLGGIKDYDVGDRVEVRARRMPSSNCDLGYHPGKDKDHAPYVLAHVWGIDGKIGLVGWLYGHEIMARPTRVEPWKVRYVGPPYREIDELIKLFGRVRENCS